MATNNILAGIITSETIQVVPLEITRGAVVNRLLVIYENVIDPATLKASLVRADLTGATIIASFVDKNTGQVIIAKSSTVPAQIEILPQVVSGVDQPTKGQAVLKFVQADTETLQPMPNCCCEYEVWVTLSDGRKDAVIDRSPFCVQQRIPPTV